MNDLPAGGYPGALHDRIAQRLGWTRAEVRTLSLPSLREVLRGTGQDAKLVHDLDVLIRSGEHIVGEPARRLRLVLRCAKCNTRCTCGRVDELARKET